MQHKGNPGAEALYQPRVFGAVCRGSSSNVEKNNEKKSREEGPGGRNRRGLERQTSYARCT